MAGEYRIRIWGARGTVPTPNPAKLRFGGHTTCVAGAIGDEVSLGFVAATEERVCNHLRDHLKQLPDEDRKSQLILQQMLEDEQRHGENALAAGGKDFPQPVKDAMTTAAAIDRVVHHSVILELDVPSYRAEEAEQRTTRRRSKKEAQTRGK